MSAVVYFSKTGQTKKYVEKVTGNNYRLVDEPFEMSEPHILVIPSYETHVYELIYHVIEDFLEYGDNLEYCKGIYATGNRNFNTLFGVTGDTIGQDYDIPVLHYLEFQGSQNDVDKLKGELDRIGNTTKTG